MDTLYSVYKKRGETPLEALTRVRLQENIGSDVSMTYAGRLDPMAEGILLVLVGDACNENTKKKYLNLDKEYVAEILIGVATDTHDILGKVIKHEDNIPETVIASILETAKKYIGEFEQTYPVFSSKTVSGKQLFNYGKNMTTVDLPTHLVSIDGIDYISQRIVDKQVLLKNIVEDVSLVTGDFRQQEIISLWQDTVSCSLADYFTLVTVRIVCGSGMYVRQLVSDIGKDIDTPLTLFSLKRTRVGEWRLD